ncbi:WGxxGxxG family protein [Microvirga arabica]|uniref:WGxxGxxG family protein n=1 Tax=Microvirga arabica TaxID=1128671 RepID=UPI001939A0FD|nr:WGxxGxxG family protein [Microvirga arabica]MBM1169879.1 WGxxGxxG-CTERM domain-containing protein [Microvirga arabica]
MNIGLLRVSTLALVLLAASPSLVLAQGAPAPGGGGANTTQNDDGTDYGWIGLLGLVGLAGLMGRRNRDTTRH